MKKMLKKSKGFTLVELLIVIIIIGILAGMMMLASGAATDKAEATKIVSNMRNIKAAEVMYYADHNAWTENEFKGAGGTASSLDKYMDQKADSKYSVKKDGDAINVVFTPVTGDPAQGVLDKLKAAAKDSGLYNGTSGDEVYGGSGAVYMRIK